MRKNYKFFLFLLIIKKICQKLNGQKKKVFEESKKYSSLSEFAKNVDQHIQLLENTDG